MKATSTMYAAAAKAIRTALDNYSSFDSAMVSDALLNQVVKTGLDAAMLVAPVPHPAPPPPKAS